MTEGKHKYKIADLVEAIEKEKQAHVDMSIVFPEIFKVGTCVYWYTKRCGKKYRQDGTVIDNNRSPWISWALKVQNIRTKKEVWLSLYDLRFYLDMESDRNANS